MVYIYDTEALRKEVGAEKIDDEGKCIFFTSVEIVA
jgi:hypothetical protein